MTETIISIQHIHKAFNTIQALEDVSFDVRRGEILGLLGANGAGKSTLLKILGGVQQSDSGKILLEGQPFAPKTPYEAASKGIISVYQELNLFRNMSVAENLFIGHEITRGNLVDWRKTFREAGQMLAAAGVTGIGPRDIVGSLSVANQQLVELTRALHQAPKVLLLDEPTASLSEDEIKWLFTKIHELTSKGTTVIYVSHRLDEVVELCDRCVVLRDGRHASTLEHDEINRDNIVFHMVGKQIEAQNRVSRETNGDVIFSCSNLTMKGAFSKITFNARAGEIVGIAGLMGSGRSELLNCIFGVQPITSGFIEINHQKIKISTTADAIKNNIVLVTEDRKREGLFLPESSAVNLASTTLPNRQHYGIIDKKKEASETRRMAISVMLDTNRLATPVTQLSGGNQQKVVIGKALLTNAEVILLDEPTRGVDVSARHEIYTIMREAAQSGKAIILVSSDWDELINYSDRILVMSEGELVGEFNASEVDEEKILQLCTSCKAQQTRQRESSGIWQRISQIFSANPNTWILAGLLLLLATAGSLVTPFFMNKANLNNIIWQSFVFFLLTLGQLIVIIAGGIDLSISAIMSLSSIIGIKLMLLLPDQPWLGMVAMVAVGLMIGVINGVLVVIGNIDSFVATLGVQIVLSGLALLITSRPLSPTPEFLKFIANKSFLGLPIVLYIGVALFIVMAIFLNRARLGRYLFAVGENPVGAVWSGLRANWVKLSAFVMAAAFAVLAGFYMLGRSGAAEPAVDTNMALNSIAYALIGGGMLTGGKGSITGSLLAALAVTVLVNILNHLGLNAFWQHIIRGTVLVVILVIYEARIKKQSETSKV